MPKVTVEGRGGSRAYSGSHVMVSVVTCDREGGAAARVFEDPSNWEGGLGLFIGAVQALNLVAGLQGNEKFKVAAREALKAVAKFESDGKEVGRGK